MYTRKNSRPSDLNSNKFNRKSMLHINELKMLSYSPRFWISVTQLDLARTQQRLDGFARRFNFPALSSAAAPVATARRKTASSWLLYVRDSPFKSALAISTWQLFFLFSPSCLLYRTRKNIERKLPYSLSLTDVSKLIFLL